MPTVPALRRSRAARATTPWSRQLAPTAPAPRSRPTRAAIPRSRRLAPTPPAPRSRSSRAPILPQRCLRPPCKPKQNQRQHQSHLSQPKNGYENDKSSFPWALIGVGRSELPQPQGRKRRNKSRMGACGESSRSPTGMRGQATVSVLRETCMFNDNKLTCVASLPASIIKFPGEREENSRDLLLDSLTKSNTENQNFFFPMG